MGGELPNGINPEWVESIMRHEDATLSGLNLFWTQTQGSSFVATLG